MIKKGFFVRYCQPFSILREGIIFGSSSFFLAFFAGSVSCVLSLPFIIFGLWALYFFRDPMRVHPDAQDVAVSPADGVILSVDIHHPAPLSQNRKKPDVMQRISIFMNAFDVHVNRMPLKGEIQNIHYIKGKFLNASLDKSSDLNERCIYTCVSGKTTFFVVQIAGFIARRIVPFCSEGEQLALGDRIGLIRFGSKVDIYLPSQFAIQVKKGQRTIAGETILAQEKK